MNDYEQFLAEQYEIEDEYWEDMAKEEEAEYWINEHKNFGI